MRIKHLGQWTSRLASSWFEGQLHGLEDTTTAAQALSDVVVNSSIHLKYNVISQRLHFSDAATIKEGDGTDEIKPADRKKMLRVVGQRDGCLDG